MAAHSQLGEFRRYLERFDIQRVDQVIDYLGMMGDAADNIPGIRGVGKKDGPEIYCRIRFDGGTYLQMQMSFKRKNDKRKSRHQKEIGML